MNESQTWIEKELAELREQNLLREVREYPSAGGIVRMDGREYLNFSSNDYLDLANNAHVKVVAQLLLKKLGSGAGASRLVTGTLTCHTELEKRLADLKGYPTALVFGSGYLANVGLIPALVGKTDFVFADKLAHASIIDGAILSRARLHRFNHNNPEHLDGLLRKTPSAGRRLLITESVFSMDGDIAPLRELAAVAENHNAMFMVDEAHSTGVFGPGGSGLVGECGLESRVAVSMATLSKALASYGGFVACSATMREFLVNRARAFIYTTAPPPAVIGAALGALDELKRRPGMGADLLERAAFFRTQLKAAGLNVGSSASQIVPVIVGDSAKALALSQSLRKQGIIAAAIRPPTVPQGTARLRLSITLAHSKDDLAKAAGIIVGCAQAEGII
jgi:glycine C-acetyltransferase/8-amino-7-oxononanoate synthase